MFDDAIQLILRTMNYIRLKFFCKFSYKKKDYDSIVNFVKINIIQFVVR